MPTSTRRAFLQISASSAAAAALSKTSPVWGQASRSQRTVRGWITADTRRFAPMEAPQWKTAAGSAGGEEIRIDPATRYQEILGFGGAFTDASCSLFSQLNAQNRRTLLDELYGPAGLRFSVGRVCIGSSDYTTSIYSFDDSPEPDPELARFTIEHDRAYILPCLRTARELNPNLYLFSAPWSPPAWMKPNNSMLGGCMDRKYFAAYADYFVRFLKAYAAEGAPVSATTVQNEVDTDQDRRMPACIWSQQDEVVFVTKFLGPALERASLSTKIWILDHNYNLWGRVLDQLSDPDFAKYVDSVAWHAYQGTPDAMTRVHEAFPGKGTQWTEGGAVITDSDFDTDWAKWSQTFTGVLENWGQSIVGWNLALDENGKPNMGPGQSGGIVTIHSGTQKITRCGQYWAFAHYSKLVERGARRLASQGEISHVGHAALENPDGSYVLVLTNTGSQEQRVQCSIAGDRLETTLPADSVVTLHW